MSKFILATSSPTGQEALSPRMEEFTCSPTYSQQGLKSKGNTTIQKSHPGKVERTPQSKAIQTDVKEIHTSTSRQRNPCFAGNATSTSDLGEVKGLRVDIWLPASLTLPSNWMPLGESFNFSGPRCHWQQTSHIQILKPSPCSGIRCSQELSHPLAHPPLTECVGVEQQALKPIPQHHPSS